VSGTVAYSAAWSPGSAAESAWTRGPARLLFLLALLVIPGSQILLYPILWILMPLQRPGEFLVAVNHPAGAPQPA
jgi:hypothetical protein